MLDRFMFDHLLLSPSLVMVRFVRAKAYVCPYVFDGVVMHKLVKRDIFLFVIIGRTNN